MSEQMWRVLLVHERYKTPGGEDEAVKADSQLLSSAGHRVGEWFVDNTILQSWSPSARLRLAWETSWSGKSYRRMLSLIRETRPDIVHFHNTLPIISPSAIHASHDSGLPTVMTLHNYRIMCPAGTFLRKGRICEECHTKSLARSVVYGCYRGSRMQSAVLATMLAVHRRLGTWSRCVDAYIAPSEFLRAKVIQGGLPFERVHVRANCVRVEPSEPVGPETFAIFVGRLSEEKGISSLLEAARLMATVKIKIIGTGPMEAAVREAALLAPNVQFLGPLPHSRTIEEMRRASVLIFPSLWYEIQPMTILEALACGVPVVATCLGEREEILKSGGAGCLFKPGDAKDLAAKVLRLMSEPRLRRDMSSAARELFNSRYSTQKSYEDLMQIYRTAQRTATRGKAA